MGARKTYPHRWAAIAIAAGGIFWSYAPDALATGCSTLPTDYARAVGHTPSGSSTALKTPPSSPDRASSV